MTYYLNSWLDRADPFISINDKSTGETLIRIEKNELDDYLDQGLFCIEELCESSAKGQQELIKAITLARCKRDLKCGLEALFDNCKANAFCPSRSNNNIVVFPEFQKIIALNA